MTDPILVKQIAGIVRTVGRIPKEVAIDAETDLVADLRIDSLDLFAVVLAVQDRYDLMVDVDDLPDLNRVADLAGYVEHQRSAAAA